MFPVLRRCIPFGQLLTAIFPVCPEIISTCAVADPTARRCCNKLHAVKPPDYNHTGGFIDDLPNIDKRIRPEKPEALIRCFWQNTPCIESSIA